MNNPAIFLPMLALGGWTLAVLLLIPLIRARAVRRGEARPADFRLAEPAGLPEYVQLPNRNYQNLLQLPVVFYMVCLVLYLSGAAGHAAVALAWAFVLLRVLHSAIHLTRNRLAWRMAAFAASCLVLMALWLVALVHLLRQPAY